MDAWCVTPGVKSMLVYILRFETFSFTELTLLLHRGVTIPENEVLDKEDLGTDEAGALSVVTPYSAGNLSFHYPNSNQLVQEESLGFFWISSTEILIF